MKWTKAHSKNAVAAKARKRIARANCLPDDAGDVVFCAKAIKPRKAKPDFILRLEDRFGERLQISIHRLNGKVMIPGGVSVRQLCRGIEQLITKSA